MTIDLGTGDGLFPYRCAREHSDRLYIGIDPNLRPLEKISEKIYRKPERGGAPNVLYLQASAEALPEELDGIADEVFILYPWGSLLRGVLVPEVDLLKSFRRICRFEALLQLVIAIDPQRDHGELERQGLQLNTPDLKSILIPAYEQAGFVFVTDRPMEFRTTWSSRLQQNTARVTVALQFRATVWSIG